MCSRKHSCLSSFAVSCEEFTAIVPHKCGQAHEAMAFDPIFCWLQDAIIPRNLAGLDFLQPVPSACADDFAVAASSFRRLMTALTPAFKVVDQIAGLNLNHRKCCWVQYGCENCQSLLDWVATNCKNLVK